MDEVNNGRPSEVKVNNINEINKDWLIRNADVGGRTLQKVVVPQGTVEEARNRFMEANMKAGRQYGRGDQGYVEEEPEFVEEM